MSLIMFPFHGDGRILVHPRNAPEGTTPKSIRTKQARMLIESFMAAGCTYHSDAGATAWVLATFCESNDLEYEFIRGDPEKGQAGFMSKTTRLTKVKFSALHPDVQKLIEEAALHLETKQDMDRIRDLAKALYEKE